MRGITQAHLNAKENQQHSCGRLAAFRVNLKGNPICWICAQVPRGIQGLKVDVEGRMASLLSLQCHLLGILCTHSYFPPRVKAQQFHKDQFSQVCTIIVHHEKRSSTAFLTNQKHLTTKKTFPTGELQCGKHRAKALLLWTWVQILKLKTYWLRTGYYLASTSSKWR